MKTIQKKYGYLLTLCFLIAINLLTGCNDQTKSSEATNHCTMSISCESILSHQEDLVPEKKDIIPEQGIVFASTEISFSQGETAFDVLQRICQEEKIPMEFRSSPMDNATYIEGIANLYSQDCGSLSGWLYEVNGMFLSCGCNEYVLQEGDCLQWVYTCEMGEDIEGTWQDMQ